MRWGGGGGIFGEVCFCVWPKNICVANLTCFFANVDVSCLLLKARCCGVQHPPAGQNPGK